MSKQLILRKGTSAEHSAFIGAEGEITMDTTTKQLKLHDGMTAGGLSVGTGTLATTTTPGLMSAADKVKVDASISSSAVSALIPGPVTTTTNGLMIAADKAKLDTAYTKAQIDTMLAGVGGGVTTVATTTANGLMSAADKVELNRVGASTAAKLPRVYGTRVLKNVGGVLKCGDEPIREMGLNYYQGPLDYLSTGSLDFIAEFKKIAEHGWRFVRIPAGPFWKNGWNATYGTDKAAYFKKLKMLLDVAQQNNLGLIFSVFWMYQTQADITGEDIAAAYENDGTGGTTKSAMYTRCGTIIQEYAQAFASHPALAAWEVGNEYTIPPYNAGLPKVRPAEGTKASYAAPADVITITGMRKFYTFFSAEIKKYDTTGRLLMTGNGGPASTFEKSIEYYTNELLLADNMGFDSVSNHLYQTNNVGGRGYDATKDILIHCNKKAQSVGKVFVLGEFGAERAGMRPANGYGSPETLYVACEAVYKSGIQLALAWNWERNTSTTVDMAFSFHPDNTENDGAVQHEIYKSYNAKMRADGYIDTSTINIQPIATRGGQAAVVASTAPKVLMQAADSASLKRADGFSIGFWLKKIAGGPTSEQLVVEKMNTASGFNSGFNIGLTAMTTTTVGSVTTVTGSAPFVQVRWSVDGSQTNNRGIGNAGMMAQLLPTDGWRFYVFQLEMDNTSVNKGLTVYQDGYWISTDTGMLGDANGIGAKVWNPADTPLGMFSGTTITSGALASGFAKPSCVAMKDVMMFNRSLNDREVRDLYLYGLAPQNTLSAHWTLDGVFDDATGNGNTLDMATTTGAVLPTFEAFTK